MASVDQMQTINDKMSGVNCKEYRRVE